MRKWQLSGFVLFVGLVACTRYRISGPSDYFLDPGSRHLIEMPECDPTLHALVHQSGAVPAFTLQLPEDYDPEKSYPLRVELPGNDGGDGRRTVGEDMRHIGDRSVVVAIMP